MRLGGPVFVETRDPGELAAAHRAEGYRAAYCPAWLSVEDPDPVREFTAALARHDVILAEVGAWGPILHPDPETRRQAEEHAIRRLALADLAGARCCVDYTGTLAPDREVTAPDGGTRRVTTWYHPDNLSQDTFDAIVEIARRILDAVQPTRTVFALEMMPSVHPDCPDGYLRLLEAIDRPRQFAVHLDPVNIITSPRRYYDTTAVLEECFDKLGPHIASCHGKDVLLTDGFIVHLDECRPGLGVLDYRTYLRLLEGLPQQPPLMLEHLPNAAEYRLARHFVLQTAADLGIPA